jgi:hypothetical protein
MYRLPIYFDLRPPPGRIRSTDVNATDNLQAIEEDHRWLQARGVGGGFGTTRRLDAFTHS